MRTLSTCRMGVERPSPLSVFRPDDFSTRPQLTSPCDTVPRNDKSCFSGCHSCCVLARSSRRGADPHASRRYPRARAARTGPARRHCHHHPFGPRPFPVSPGQFLSRAHDSAKSVRKSQDMSWLPELLAGPGVNFNSGRRGKTAVLSEGAGVQGAAASDRGGTWP
jgi:hypothetical protein